MKEENKTKTPGVCTVNDQTQDDCRCKAGRCVNTHFTLSVIAVCLSCFTGFFAIPLALAALILSLRAQDQVQQGRTEDGARTAYWAALFGWITVIIAVLPVVIILFFGGAILAGLTAFLSAM